MYLIIHTYDSYLLVQLLKIWKRNLEYIIDENDSYVSIKDAETNKNG